MRARALVLASVVLATSGCGTHDRAAPGDSLRALRQLRSGQNSFGVILDARSGRALAAFRVNNPIRAAVADGNGGWYIGGGFIHVDGAFRRRLAHIRRDGTLDPGWHPEANGNGVSVTALARRGSRLYVGGDFAILDHRRRLHLAAVDAGSGRLDARWRAGSAPLGPSALVAAGDRLLVGSGSCCSEGGASVVALRAESGAVDSSWRPHVGRIPLHGNGVYMLAADGRAVLIRGNAIGEIDPRSGALAHKWRGHACAWCSLLAAAVGEHRVYASGNGSPAVDAFARGARDRAWRARLFATTGFYGATSAVAISATPDRVYLGGDFDRVNGVAANGLAALDPTNASVLPAWQPVAPTVYASVLARSASRLLVGIDLSPEARFDFTGLKTYRPVRRLRLVLALSGPGSVRIGIGGHCDYERWVAVSARCPGPVERWLGTVQFRAAGRKRYANALAGVSRGQHFVRFVVRPAGRSKTLTTEFWFRRR